MAKIISFFTAIFLALQSLFGIGGLRFGKVVLVLEKDSYAVGTETVAAELYNCTLKPIPTAPYAYSLERWEGGAWTRIALKDTVIIPDAMVMLPPFRSAGKSFRLTDHGSLTAGRYRLAASVSAYAEFELTNGKVTIALNAETYPLGTKAVQATWYNGTGEKIWFGPSFELERWDGGKWVPVEPREPVAVPAVIYFLEPSRSKNHTYNLSHYDLQAGRWRVAARYSVDGDTGSAVIYAEFELK